MHNNEYYRINNNPQTQAPVNLRRIQGQEYNLKSTNLLRDLRELRQEHLQLRQNPNARVQTRSIDLLKNQHLEQALNNPIYTNLEVNPQQVSQELEVYSSTIQPQQYETHNNILAHFYHNNKTGQLITTLIQRSKRSTNT